jgi:hypothetical protein
VSGELPPIRNSSDRSCWRSEGQPGRPLQAGTDRTHKLTVDVSAHSHWAPHRLNVRLLDQDFPRLVEARAELARETSPNIGERAHLIAQPLDVHLRQLLAVGEMRDPCELTKVRKWGGARRGQHRSRFTRLPPGSCSLPSAPWYATLCSCQHAHPPP